MQTKSAGIWRNVDIWLVILNFDVLAGKGTKSKEISGSQGIWGHGNPIGGFMIFN